MFDVSFITMQDLITSILTKYSVVIQFLFCFLFLLFFSLSRSHIHERKMTEIDVANISKTRILNKKQKEKKITKSENEEKKRIETCM